jgi:hypothetical protein
MSGKTQEVMIVIRVVNGQSMFFMASLVVQSLRMLDVVLGPFCGTAGCLVYGPAWFLGMIFVQYGVDEVAQSAEEVSQLHLGFWTGCLRFGC